MSVQKDDLVMEIESLIESDRYTAMEVTDSEKNVMASGATGSVTCSLHPLVIMNVSEHWTREKAQNIAPQKG